MDNGVVADIKQSRLAGRVHRVAKHGRGQVAKICLYPHRRLQSHRRLCRDVTERERVENVGTGELERALAESAGYFSLLWDHEFTGLA